jgi:hypothetical protein
LEARPVEEPVEDIQLWQPPAEIVDYRLEADPLSLLDSLRNQPGFQVWCEAEDKKRLGGRDRLELLPTPLLAIWTIPPGPAELHSVLQAVKPGKVVLFAVDPGLDRGEAFLQRLAGLVKYAMKSGQDWVSLPALAAATAHRLATVRAGLEWLQARGHIRIVTFAGEAAFLEKGDGIEQPASTGIAARLTAILEETAAYRQYYAHADQDSLLRLP